MTTNTSSTTRGIVVSAPNSGAGKTTVALGLMRALKKRGRTVQAFKCGPDYIDAAFHKAATGAPSINLDTWSMHERTLTTLIATASATADISIVEGAMGLFDGASTKGQYASGSSADVAALTGWPVLLVIDVARQAATAAAIIKGCASYRDDIQVCGVILNNVASARHQQLIVPAIEALGIPVVVSLRRNAELSLPERHLGLVQARENNQLEAKLDAFASLIDQPGVIDNIEQLAKPARAPLKNLPSDDAKASPGLRPPGQRIALADDAAFSFSYTHIKQSWRAQGAQILPFSPLNDEPPASDADAVWLPGGYPELHAATLAAAENFKTGMRTHATNAIPIHGECGGYMVLGRGLVDQHGRRHQMLGLLGLETSFATRKLHLGYRRAQLKSKCALGRAHDTIFGHEFHYVSVIENDDAPLADVTDAQGLRVESSGSTRANISGTFFHAVDPEWHQP